MNGFSPLVSVIVPCFNHGRFLPETLQSLVGQTYNNWECILVNDGSTDNSGEIAADWSRKEARIKYLSKPNGGLSSARNFGLNHSAGGYILFLDADDMLLPSKLQRSVKELEQLGNRKTIIVSSFEMYDDNTKKTSRPFCELSRVQFSFRSLLTGWDIDFTVPIHCAVFPADYFTGLRFEESLGAKEDWVMWLSIFKKYHPPVVVVDEKLVLYRISTGSMTAQKKLMYENTARAFEFIYKTLIDSNDIHLLIKKMNDYWLKEILLYDKENYLIRNSYYFKARDAFFGMLKRTGLTRKAHE